MRQRQSTRERLADLLTDAIGLTVLSSDIVPASGYYRTSPYADVLRWQGWIRATSDPESTYKLSVGSWDTMTACVRYGFTIDRSTARRYADIEIHANTPSHG